MGFFFSLIACSFSWFGRWLGTDACWAWGTTATLVLMGPTGQLMFPCWAEGIFASLTTRTCSWFVWWLGKEACCDWVTAEEYCIFLRISLATPVFSWPWTTLKCSCWAKGVLPLLTTCALSWVRWWLGTPACCCTVVAEETYVLLEHSLSTPVFPVGGLFWAMGLTASLPTCIFSWFRWWLGTEACCGWMTAEEYCVLLWPSLPTEAFSGQKGTRGKPCWTTGGWLICSGLGCWVGTNGGLGSTLSDEFGASCWFTTSKLVTTE